MLGCLAENIKVRTRNEAFVIKLSRFEKQKEKMERKIFSNFEILQRAVP
jgi:hypothetical protein